MLIVWFFVYKNSPNLLFGVLCIPGDQSHPFAQPTVNPLACCICWAGLLGRPVFPPWNEGPNFGSYNTSQEYDPKKGVCKSFHFRNVVTINRDYENGSYDKGLPGK